MDTHGTSSILTPSAAALHLSPTLEINEAVARARASGKRIVHLGFGEAMFPIQQRVLQIHRETSSRSDYLPVAGLESLRTTIAEYQSGRLGIKIQSDQVVVAPGSKPLLFALFDIVRGDVLLPRPSWVSYEAQVAHAGKKLFWIETDEFDRHTLTAEALEAAYNTAIQQGGQPRIMLINSPSNPTGQVFSEEEVARIVRFCREREILLISDEIYSDICFRTEERNISAFKTAQKDGGEVIMTGGMSKTYSAGGWRIGFATFPSSSVGTTIQKAILAYASECWSAASAPAQLAAAAAFSSAFTADAILGSEMDRYRDLVTVLHRMCTLRLFTALRDCGLEVAEPRGSFYLYPSFRPFREQLRAHHVRTSRDLARWLIDECGLAALPGAAFGEAEEEDSNSGGSLRLRMATSFLFYPAEDKYQKGYALLETAARGEDIELPLMDEAIECIQIAVGKLQKSG
ncbi:unnamed protein product [Alternaria burnsii]|nr:unnamed protein product [Alternaria burnsii]